MKILITIAGISIVATGCITGQQWMIYLGGVIIVLPLAAKI